MYLLWVDMCPGCEPTFVSETIVHRARTARPRRREPAGMASEPAPLGVVLAVLVPEVEEAFSLAVEDAVVVAAKGMSVELRKRGQTTNQFPRWWWSWWRQWWWQ